MSVLDFDNLTAEQTQTLNRVAGEIRSEFNQLVADASRSDGGGIDWFVASVASRSPAISPLFSRCCVLAVVCDALDGPVDLREVVVSDPWLAGVLRSYSRERKKALDVRCRRPARVRLRALVRVLRNLAGSSLLLAQRCWNRRRIDPDILERGEPLTLIDTFVLNQSEDARAPDGPSSVPADRYYPGLLDAVPAERRDTVRFLPTLLGFGWSRYRRVVQELRQSRHQSFVGDDFLRASDYVFAMGHPARVLARAHRLGGLEFRRFHVGSLLRQELRATAWNYGSISGLLNYQLARRMSEHRVPVRKLIDWYENQPIDRGLIAGFRRFYPGVPIHGYQGYIASSDTNLHLRPTASEVEAGLVPDRILVVGVALKDQVGEFCDQFEVDVGPAFRFEEAFTSSMVEGASELPCILVALPISVEESRRILALAAESLLDRTGETSYVLLVCPHPAHGSRARRLWGEAADRHDGVRVSEDPFYESLARSDLLVSSMSSVCMVALARGVPVIIVGPRSAITENPIPMGVPDEMWETCHDSGVMRDAAKRFLEATSDTRRRRQELGRAIRSRFFEPVTEDSVCRFLWS